MVWQRGGSSCLRWEVEVLGAWSHHELVFTGSPRGGGWDSLPCTIHDVVRMWTKPGRRRTSFDSKVLRASRCRTIADGTRPYSVQEHVGGAARSEGMSWSKPVISMAMAMSYVDAGSCVWDPCAGSGSSLVAAQRHGRIWCGAELQPRWADLILRRWEEETGEVAKLEAGPVGLTSPAPALALALQSLPAPVPAARPVPVVRRARSQPRSAALPTA